MGLCVEAGKLIGGDELLADFDCSITDGTPCWLVVAGKTLMLG
jgi:hypothetical protein